MKEKTVKMKFTSFVTIRKSAAGLCGSAVIFRTNKKRAGTRGSGSNDLFFLFVFHTATYS